MPTTSNAPIDLEAMMNTLEVKQRVCILRSMDYIIRTMQHENAYEEWILVVPDEADEQDFEEIAQDDEGWSETCSWFRTLVKRYGKYGW